MKPAMQRVMILLMVVGLLLVSPANAHNVTIFAWSEGETVHTESKFSGGKRVKGGKVEVFDGGGTLLLEGQTDDNGDFSFQTPKITDLKIVLTAGMGHQNSWLLSAAELAGGESPAAPPASSTPPERQHPMQPESGMTAVLTEQEIEAIVARQLDQKLQPLTRLIVASRDTGPSMRDIVGGLGYIVGLVGVGAYLRYRKERRRS